MPVLAATEGKNACVLPAVKAATFKTANYQLAPDSSNFVRASVLVASPGNEFYSNLGHITIRMECPVHNLDFCFSFMSNSSTVGIVNFFAGNAEGHIYAVESSDYIRSFIKEGRAVEQWTLNLTLHEQQRLWQLLDEDLVDADKRKFNFAKNNCTSIALLMMESALIEGDVANFVWPTPLHNASNAEAMSYCTRKVPWMNFLCLSLSGIAAEDTYDNYFRMSPEMVLPLLKASTIKNKNGTERPFLTGEHFTISQATCDVSAGVLTPTVLFALILLFITLGCFVAVKINRSPSAGTRWVAMLLKCGWLLLVWAHIAISVALLYMTMVAGLFDTRWNWFLVPFNLVPEVLWLVARRRAWYNKVYAGYAAVIGLFCVVGALWLEVFTVPHFLLLCCFALPLLSKHLICQRAGLLKSRHPISK